MSTSAPERRSDRTGRARERFGAQAEAALDALARLDLEWREMYGEVSPPAHVMDDIWDVCGGDLDLLVSAARLAVLDPRDLRVWADEKQSPKAQPVTEDPRHDPSRSGPSLRSWTRVPTAVVVLLLACSLVMSLGLVVGVSEERSLSASTYGELLPGGENVFGYKSGGDCQGMVRFAVDGQTYTLPGRVRGYDCPEVRAQRLTIRYRPGDPTEFATDDEDWFLYGFLLAALITSVALLVLLASRVFRRSRSNKGA